MDYTNHILTALVPSGGGPEALLVLLEGESLFNDATSIVLFDIFLKDAHRISEGNPQDEKIFELAWRLGLEILRMAGGGIIVGFLTGIVTR